MDRLAIKLQHIHLLPLIIVENDETMTALALPLIVMIDTFSLTVTTL